MGIASTLAVSIGVLVGVARKQVANGVAYEKDSLKRSFFDVNLTPRRAPVPGTVYREGLGMTTGMTGSFDKSLLLQEIDRELQSGSRSPTIVVSWQVSDNTRVMDIISFSYDRIKKHISYFPGTGPNVEAANVTDADIHWMAETPNGSLPDLIRVLASRR